MAPEMVSGQTYGTKVDIWALGAITYQLFTENPPFNGNDINELFDNIKNHQLTFEEEVWKEVSEDVVHFLTLCLKKDPKKRPHAAQLLRHSWLHRNPEPTPLKNEK